MVLMLPTLMVTKSGKASANAKAGDLKFVDYNNDGKIDDKDRQYCGSATPKTTYAFTLGATYKKLSVSAMFQGVGGAQAFYAAKYMTLSDVDGNFNRTKEILNARVRQIPLQISPDCQRMIRIQTSVRHLIGIWKMLLICA